MKKFLKITRRMLYKKYSFDPFLLAVRKNKVDKTSKIIYSSIFVKLKKKFFFNLTKNNFFVKNNKNLNNNFLYNIKKLYKNNLIIF